jgi:hypothetical protein
MSTRKPRLAALSQTHHSHAPMHVSRPPHAAIIDTIVDLLTVDDATDAEQS